MTSLLTRTVSLLTGTVLGTGALLVPATASAAPLAPPVTVGAPTGVDDEVEAAADRLAREALGTFTVAELAALARDVPYDDGTFDLVEATATDMQAAMNAGVITSVELTERYLARIQALDDVTVDTAPGGRPLNAVLATNTEALAAAAASDAARTANGGPRSMVDGVPILVKDNYDTVDAPTTAGCDCWAENLTDDDATMVTKLRESGAVVMAKASLDEFAFGFTSQYSLGSPPGGSTFVASPYNTAQTAGGSSGGTGAGISANLGGIGFGTDTGGSIRVPSSYNQLVGVRPTLGLTSRSGIVPLALSQDTGGPMARTVTDAAAALEAVAGTDPSDPATAEADANSTGSYLDALDPDALQGVRLGYLPQMVETTNATTNRLFAESVAALRAQGAVVEPIQIDGIDAVLGEPSGSTNEFQHDLDRYVADHLAQQVAFRTLQSIIDSGRFVQSRQGTYQQRAAVTEAQYQAWITAHTKVLSDGRDLVTGALDAGGLSALIYPSGTTYGTWRTNLRLSPNTGMPSVTVPMGESTAADATLADAGVNLEFLGRAWDEADLLGLTYDFEQATRARSTPALYGPLEGDVVAGPGTDADAPGDGSVRVSGPLGSVTPGQTVEVTVSADAADLYAYDLALDYDRSRLEYVSATSGTSGITSTVDDGSALRVIHTKVGTSPGAQGDTALATVTFRARNVGSASVSAASLTTVDTQGAAASRQDLGAVAVQVVPAGIAATATTLTFTPSPVAAGSPTTLQVAVSTGAVTPDGEPAQARGYVLVFVTGQLFPYLARVDGGQASIPITVRQPGVTPVVSLFVSFGGFGPSVAATTLPVTG